MNALLEIRICVSHLQGSRGKISLVQGYVGRITTRFNADGRTRTHDLMPIFKSSYPQFLLHCTLLVISLFTFYTFLTTFDLNGRTVPLRPIKLRLLPPPSPPELELPCSASTPL